jgi:hypothetical protein
MLIITFSVEQSCACDEVADRGLHDGILIADRNVDSIRLRISDRVSELYYLML